MACNTGRCALRRFDGHSSGSYKPSNSILASENEQNLTSLLVARNKLDSDLGRRQLPEGNQNHSIQNLASGKPESNSILEITRIQKAELEPEPKQEIITIWKTPSASNWQKPEARK